MSLENNVQSRVTKHDEFISAVISGNIEDVRRLFKSHYTNKKDGSYGMTALHFACMHDNIDIVRYLLDNDCDIECEDSYDRNRPIHLAAFHGHLSIVKELINRECLLNVRNKFERTPLQTATSMRNSECATILSEAMKEQEGRVTKTMYRQFLSALNRCDIEDVKRLFKPEFINEQFYNGSTGLHFACTKTNVDIVRYLLDNGYNIEYEDVGKCRPIHVAALHGSLSIVKELIDQGCILDVRDKDQHSPLDIAIMCKNNECAEELRLAMEEPEINRKMKHAVNSLTKRNGDVLGQGAFGCVIKCTDEHVGYDFAAKRVILNQDSTNDDELKGMTNEIQIFNRLKNHDRIVKYYGTHSDKYVAYIFMERLTGGSIADHLRNVGALPTDVIARYTKQILDGLAFLHQNAILHRDIKGANILRDDVDNIKLCDFGLSRFLKKLSSRNSLEKANTSCGTAYWMAPEVIKSEEYRFPADIWSVGATVVEMLTGKHPYPDLDPNQAMFRIGMTGKLEFTQPENISLRSFIGQMLVADPNERASITSLMESDFIRDIPERSGIKEY